MSSVLYVLIGEAGVTPLEEESAGEIGSII
jgi:hypothetical protein